MATPQPVAAAGVFARRPSSLIAKGGDSDAPRAAPATTPAASGGDSPPAAAAAAEDPADAFACNICLELARDPVVTLCGHLHCWPCLYRWMRSSDAKECPVCKSELSEERVVPLYGRGCGGQDPRKLPVEEEVIPARPSARRLSNSGSRHGNGALGGQLPILGLQVQSTGAPGTYANLLYGEPLSPEQQQQAFLSRLLLMLGSFVIMCLLLF